MIFLSLPIDNNINNMGEQQDFFCGFVKSHKGKGLTHSYMVMQIQISVYNIFKNKRDVIFWDHLLIIWKSKNFHL